MSPDTMDKEPTAQLPGWLLHPDLTPEGFDQLRYGCGFYKRPRVNPRAPVSPSVAELLNRGAQILEDLERAHRRLIDSATEALEPTPQAWKAAKGAMASYMASYAELAGLAKKLNFLISTEAKELLSQPVPQDTGVHGLVDSNGQEVEGC